MSRSSTATDLGPWVALFVGLCPDGLNAATTQHWQGVELVAGAVESVKGTRMFGEPPRWLVLGNRLYPLHPLGTAEAAVRATLPPSTEERIEGVVEYRGRLFVAKGQRLFWLDAGDTDPSGSIRLRADIDALASRGDVLLASLEGATPSLVRLQGDEPRVVWEAKHLQADPIVMNGQHAFAVQQVGRDVRLVRVALVNGRAEGHLPLSNPLASDLVLAGDQLFAVTVGPRVDKEEKDVDLVSVDLRTWRLESTSLPVGSGLQEMFKYSVSKNGLLAVRGRAGFTGEVVVAMTHEDGRLWRVKDGVARALDYPDKRGNGGYGEIVQLGNNLVLTSYDSLNTIDIETGEHRGKIRMPDIVHELAIHDKDLLVRLDDQIVRLQPASQPASAAARVQAIRAQPWFRGDAKALMDGSTKTAFRFDDEARIDLVLSAPTVVSQVFLTTGPQPATDHKLYKIEIQWSDKELGKSGKVYKPKVTISDTPQQLLPEPVLARRLTLSLECYVKGRSRRDKTAPPCSIAELSWQPAVGPDSRGGSPVGPRIGAGFARQDQI